ncbi:MAG: hypothetical protein IKI11_08000 [Neisseriaceae bacterium]|nr:hypothetical protein [Neisseriaceae bacterium]
MRKQNRIRVAIKKFSGSLKRLIYLIDKGIATPCIARLAMTRRNLGNLKT